MRASERDKLKTTNDESQQEQKMPFASQVADFERWKIASSHTLLMTCFTGIANSGATKMPLIHPTMLYSTRMIIVKKKDHECMSVFPQKAVVQRRICSISLNDRLERSDREFRPREEFAAKNRDCNFNFPRFARGSRRTRKG